MLPRFSSLRDAKRNIRNINNLVGAVLFQAVRELPAMSLLERLELAEWKVRHLRWHDILGTHQLWRDAAAKVVPPWRNEARLEREEQKFWDHMYSDGWLPVSACRPDRPEHELRAALAEYERQIPLLEQSIKKTDATLRRHGL